MLFSFSFYSSSFCRQTNTYVYHNSLFVFVLTKLLTMIITKTTHAIYISFLVVENEHFHWNKNDIFLIFAKNIDCGYT